ncbi:MAG: hypothetical protein ACOCXM_03325 [Myxococcota bacterium]
MQPSPVEHTSRVQGKAKGTILLHLRDFVTREAGADTWTQLVDGLPAEDRSLLGSMLLVGSWYPVGAWNRLLGAFLSGHYRDSDAGMAEVARFIAERDLNMVFKLILKMGSPEFLLKRTGSIWARYFDAGDLTHQELAPKRWRLDLTVAEGGPEAAPDRHTCGPGVAAWIQRGLEITGVRGRVELVDTRSEGPLRRYEYRATW